MTLHLQSLEGQLDLSDSAELPTDLGTLLEVDED